MGTRVKKVTNSFDDRFSLFPVVWGIGIGLIWGVGELAVSAFSLGYLSKVFVLPVLVADGFVGFVFGVLLSVARSIAGVQGRALVGAALVWLPAMAYTALKVQADLLPALAWWHPHSLLILAVLGALGYWGAHRGFIRLFDPKVRIDLATLVTGATALGMTLIGMGLFVRVRGRFPHAVWAWLTVLAMPFLLDRASRDLTRALRQLSGVQQNRGRYALAALAAFFVLGGWEYFDHRGLLPQQPPLVGALASTPPSAPPNLVLVVLSGVRADHLTAYGYGPSTSPGLASLARSADRYVRCYSTSASCEPACSSLMTALPPSLQALVRPAREAFPPTLAGLVHEEEGRPGTPLAEVLRRKGYRTLAVVARRDGSVRRQDLAQGFEVYDDRPRLQLAGNETPVLFKVQKRLRRTIERWFEGAAPWVRGEYFYHFQPGRTAEEVLQSVAVQLRSGRRGPLFLFVYLADARAPYVPPREFLPLDEGIDLRLWGGLPSGEIQQINCGQRTLTEEERRTFGALYDGEIRYLDHWLGQLLESLENTSLLPRSLVVVAADCGVLLGEEGRLGEGVDLLPAALHVPLIVKRPGQVRSERYAEPISLGQVKSLVLREMGILHRPAPGEYVHEEGLDQPIVAEWSLSPDLVEACTRQWPNRLKALVLGQRMLVTDFENERRLYDLSVPGQAAAVSIEQASDEVRYLEERLLQWQALLPVEQ